MSFTTVIFFLFLLVGIIVYYALPQKIQWAWLLIMSYAYYFTFSVKTSIFMVFTTLVVYAGGRWLDKVNTESEAYLAKNKKELSREEKKAYKTAVKKKKRRISALIIVIAFGVLATVKYCNFAIENINAILSLTGSTNTLSFLDIALPIGISFYTFQSVSYIIDVYQGKYRSENNVFKFALFVSFFPQLLQGPIGRFDKLGHQFYEGHKFDLKTVQFGLQRIGWGIAKKVILADRTAPLVNNVFGNFEMYTGFHYIMAVLMYSVQLYMDFSGGIDIVIGVAQMFGITMDENFRQPYFSKSIGEFWRRWHITLGTWMKDYIFYPLSLSGAMHKFGKWSKKHFSNLAEPLYHKGLEKFHINAQGKPWVLFQIIRTFILVNIGWYFDMATGLNSALVMIKYSILGLNARQFTDGSIFTLGMSFRDYVIVIIGCIVVFIISLLKEKHINIRESIASKPIVVRWAIYYAFIIVILIWGYTGDTQGFIYANF